MIWNEFLETSVQLPTNLYHCWVGAIELRIGKLESTHNERMSGSSDLDVLKQAFGIVHPSGVSECHLMLFCDLQALLGIEMSFSRRLSIDCHHNLLRETRKSVHNPRRYGIGFQSILHISYNIIRVYARDLPWSIILLLSRTVGIDGVA